LPKNASTNLYVEKSFSKQVLTLEKSCPKYVGESILQICFLSFINNFTFFDLMYGFCKKGYLSVSLLYLNNENQKTSEKEVWYD